MITESATNAQGGPQPVLFRIYLATPGDVVHERNIAKEVIEQVRVERRFRDRLNIQLVAWDQPGVSVAMEAGVTPQAAIVRGLPKPADCDLVLVILWSRIGTPLPAEHTKSDGEPYLSGTEWEYLNGIAGYRSKGQPRVWIYRRSEVPSVALDDPELVEKQAQLAKLSVFLDQFTNSDGSIQGGLNVYARPEDFRRQFEQHLRDHLEQRLEALGPMPVPDMAVARAREEPRWAGVPYPGLEVFTPEQAPIFFGRGPEIDQLIVQLADVRTRFLAVVGVSGSGKSSLVSAGLIPRLREGVIGGEPWVDLQFKPGQRGDDPFLALAHALKQALGTTGETERALADQLRTEPARFANDAKALLANRQIASTQLLLVIDQFEELFTLVPVAMQVPFLEWLGAATNLPRVRVIVTLRADFYATAVEQPILAALLRRDRGTFPLGPPGIVALQDIVAKPAAAAGLELEEGLVARILEDAGGDPGALALVAFAMHELYLEGHEAGRLTLANYADIGGVSGAVRLRTEMTLSRLRTERKQGLESLFSHLVEVNEQEVATRRRAVKDQIQAGALVDALTRARLLVAGKGAGDAPTVEVAHEALLTAWPELADWIGQHAESLRARRDLERAASEWSKADRPFSGLRTGPMLRRYRDAAQPRSPLAGDYLKACNRRVRWRRAGLGTLAVVLLAGLVVFWHTSRSDYPPAFAVKGLLARIGLWPVPPPRMVVIPAGEFEMGDRTGTHPHELPLHPVRIGEPFEIGLYEVSFQEYDLFAAATGRDKPGDEGWGRSRRPVINVTWEDARAYARWLAGKTNLAYRLPSEAEWEYAARAGTGTVRFWEERPGQETDPACGYANVFDRGNEATVRNRFTFDWDPFPCKDRHPFTAPAGAEAYQTNPWGLYAMLGNVWEWTQDCWHPNHDEAPRTAAIARQPGEPANCLERVVRGGSWDDNPADVRSAVRYGVGVKARVHDLGFRLVRSL